MNALAKNWMETAGLLCLGLGGGLVAQWAGVPMPFMIGSLFVTAAYTIVASNRFDRKVHFPRWFRTIFIATIGIMIGAGFSPDVLATLPHLWVSLLAIVAFVVITHAACYAVSGGSADMTGRPRSTHPCPAG